MRASLVSQALGFRSTMVRAKADPMIKRLVYRALSGISGFLFSRGKSLVVSRKVLDVHKQPFLRHDDFLALNVPFEPVRKLRKRLEKSTGLKLLSRGEAHVTVITPPEFAILKNHLRMQEIEEIALREKIQEADLEILGLGEGRLDDDGGERRTYYIIVKSKRLMRIRETVENLFRARGGKKEDFVAADYYPHITVGFTHVDLHSEQGIVKDERSLRYELKVR